MSIRSEALRYLRMQSDEGIESLLDDAIDKADSLSPKYIASEFDIEKSEHGFTLFDGTEICGELAKNSLSHSKKILLLTATLTLDADRFINTATSTSSQAVINAVMSAKIEDYLDGVEQELIKKYEENGLYLTPRFSPGYGDLPLSLNYDILRLTFAEKYLGVRLSDSLMLSPIKTVTALIGISDEKHMGSTHKCANCTKQCIYRK